MTTLDTADRQRLANYLLGTHEALEGGDVDLETAHLTVLGFFNAVLDGDLKRVRDELDEYDEHVAVAQIKMAIAEMSATQKRINAELEGCGRHIEGIAQKLTKIVGTLDRIVLHCDAEALADDLDSVGRRAA